MLLTLLNITYNSTSYTLMYNTNFFFTSGINNISLCDCETMVSKAHYEVHV